LVVGTKRLPVRFYRSEAGIEPVRDWLRTLSPDDRRLIGRDMMTVEFGWPVGMPTCRPMGGGLFEVRCTLAGNRAARILFCVHAEMAVMLHGFIKKSRTTPAKDLDLAQRRQRQVTR